MSPSSIVKINAIRVPEGTGEVLEQRFAARAEAMAGVEGFVGFELLRPTGGEERYFVYTRWADEAAFQAWRASQEFAEGHAGATEGHGGQRPVAEGADLLEFEVALAVTGPAAQSS